MNLPARRIGTRAGIAGSYRCKTFCCSRPRDIVHCLLFGLLPAFRALRPSVAPSLQQTGRGGETHSRRFFGKRLVAGQVAFSVVSLSAAYSSSATCRTWSISMSASNVTTSCWFHSIRTQRVEGRTIVPRLSRAPRAVSRDSRCALGFTLRRNADLWCRRESRVHCAGYDPKLGEIRNVAENWVAPKYFETLGTPLLAGPRLRLRRPGPSRAWPFINQTMARYYFADRSPIGESVSFDGDYQRYEIVGVVGDSKLYDIREPTHRTIYFNMFQEPSPGSRFVLRTSIDPDAVALQVVRTVHSVLKTVVIKNVRTMADQVDETIVPERLIALLSGWFGALGALLAAIGLYGLLTYTVARRINEIGIRIALGATSSRVTRMVLREALAHGVRRADHRGTLWHFGANASRQR